MSVCLGGGLEQQLVVGERALGAIPALVRPHSPPWPNGLRVTSCQHFSLQLSAAAASPSSSGRLYSAAQEHGGICGSEREMDLFKDTQQENGVAKARTQAS